MEEVNSLSSALMEGLQVTAVGLVIVFAVLVILMLVLMAMKLVFYKDPKKARVVQNTAVPVQEPVKVSAKPAEMAENEEELIAVLTAAVAASLNTSTYNLRIKSYRRIGNNAPAWNKAGLEETINNHF